MSAIREMSEDKCVVIFSPRHSRQGVFHALPSVCYDNRIATSINMLSVYLMADDFPGVPNSTGTFLSAPICFDLFKLCHQKLVTCS